MPSAPTAQPPLRPASDEQATDDAPRCGWGLSGSTRRGRGCLRRACSWILLHDIGTRQLRTASSRGPGSEAFQDLAIPADTGIFGLAFMRRKVVFVPDVKEDDRWFDPSRVHAAALDSVFTIPLVHGDEVLGVVGLDSPRFTADRPPTEVHIARLEALAAQAALAITNASCRRYFRSKSGFAAT